MTPEGQLVAGRYRLRRTLGGGGMGRVWLADDERLHRAVAIKKCVLPSGLSAAEQDLVRGLMLREARAFARVTHPHVVRIEAVVPDGDEPWIVMEYVSSRSLLEVVTDGGPLAPGRVAEIGLAVLDGLGAAFRAGLLHLDVKPANVLIGDDGRIVLSDFGPMVTGSGVRELARMGIVLGSPKYLAPERLSGGVSTRASDLWSLGATLYHAVEGRPPYVRATAEATLEALATTMPDPPRRAGPLAGVLDGLLRRDPAERLSETEVRDQLSQVLHPAPVPLIRHPRPDARRRVAVAAAALVVVGGLAAAAAGGMQNDRPAVTATASALPAGFTWVRDPSGFRVAVPTGWHSTTDSGGTVVFDAGAAGPALRISPWTEPGGTAVAAFIAAERDTTLPDYHRIRIEALPEPPDAIWEFTYTDPATGPMRGLRRVLGAGPREYLLDWRTPRADWSAELPRLTEITQTFTATAG